MEKLSKEEILEEYKRLNKNYCKLEEEMDESKHCCYCLNYSGCKSETCKKCCHKCNFVRIRITDINKGE